MPDNKRKWRMLIPDNPDETLRCAIYDLYGIVDSYLTYPLAVSEASLTDPAACGENLIIIGTSKDNARIKEIAGSGQFILPSEAEGYSIQVSSSPYDNDCRMIIICGTDSAGLLYAVHAFDLRYLRDKCRYYGYHYDHRLRPFVDALPDWQYLSAPKIARRGIWTWGHVIYNYRAFFYNMSRLGMNHIIIWNDFAPLNAAEVIAEAHRRAIKIYWGFSCSWGEAVDPNNQDDVIKWTRRVIDVYSSQYANLDIDGVYFQAFTETSEKTIGSRSIAGLVADWANVICAGLRAEYPQLDIEFGVHATSIGDSYAELAKIDPEIAVMWEDCGDFPYYYDPARQNQSKAAIDYTRRLTSIHGNSTRFAAVLKGFTVLNWSKFEHYHGAIVLGESQHEYIEQRAAEKRFTWSYARPYWYTGAELLREYFDTVVNSNAREVTITALVEDGCFERTVDPAVILFASLMWDYNQDTSELIRLSEHCAEGNIL